MPDEKYGRIVVIWRIELFQPLFRCLAGVILFGAMRMEASPEPSTLMECVLARGGKGG
jgi:hypothetical protein